tara:strand:- start:571 stop:996 length:426 start_codon:yes stop_codon:yes gene_type:complete
MSEWLILSLIYVVFGWFKTKSKHKNKIKSNSLISDLSKSFTDVFKDESDYSVPIKNPDNIQKTVYDDSSLDNEYIEEEIVSKTDDSEITGKNSDFKKMNADNQKKIKRDLNTLIRDKTELKNFMIFKEVLDKPRALKKNIR